MKKAKKLLSVFLAALMVLTALSGVMMASAATNDEATAAAAAFNEKAAAVDHSGVYENMSANAAQTTKDTLNGLLGPILTAINVGESIYCDQTISSLMILLNGALGSLLTSLAPADFSKLAANAGYTEAAAYIGKLTSWDEANAADIKWGITPGNSEEFVKVSGVALNGIGQLLALAGLFGLYDPLIDVVESFHITQMPSFEDLTAAATDYDEEQSIGYSAIFVQYLVPTIDAVLANPINVLCDALPDLANSYEALVSAINGSILGMFGVQLPDLNGLVSSIGSGIGFEFPEIDVDYLTTMGEASVAESGTAGGYRMAINGNQGMVFAALMNYVGETLKTPANQVALSKLIADQIGAGYGDEVGAIVEASLNGDALAIADASVALCESIAENLGIKAEAEQSGILGFFAKVMDFFNRIARMIVDLFKSFGAKVAA